MKKKIAIKPSNINLHTSIKKIGIYDLNVRLHADVGCNLKINVATSEENAKKQKIDSETIDNGHSESSKKADDNNTDQNNEPVTTKTNDNLSKETDTSKKTSKDSGNIESNTISEMTDEQNKAKEIKNSES